MEAKLVFEKFETNEYLIRKIILSDSVSIYENWAQERDVALYTTWMPHRSEQDTHRYVDASLEAWHHGSYTWSIVTKSNSEIVGSFAARENGHKLTIGYLLAKKSWGKGSMTAVLTSFINEAFNIDYIERIGAICDVDNLASKRVMEKAELQYEGILLSWMVHPNLGNKARDCHSLSITRERHNKNLQGIK